MSDRNTPCLNPAICGVQTHRTGTLAECRVQKTRDKRSKSSENLTRTPKLRSLDELREASFTPDPEQREQAEYEMHYRFNKEINKRSPRIWIRDQIRYWFRR